MSVADGACWRCAIPMAVMVHLRPQEEIVAQCLLHRFRLRRVPAALSLMTAEELAVLGLGVDVDKRSGVIHLHQPER